MNWLKGKFSNLDTLERIAIVLILIAVILFLLMASATPGYSVFDILEMGLFILIIATIIIGAGLFLLRGYDVSAPKWVKILFWTLVIIWILVRFRGVFNF